eukprot:4191657-Lingulodinium_polyedra.AAC.1
MPGSGAAGPNQVEYAQESPQTNWSGPAAPLPGIVLVVEVALAHGVRDLRRAPEQAKSHRGCRSGGGLPR